MRTRTTWVDFALRFIDKLSWAAGVFSAAALLVMTLIVGFEVVMRHVFTRPTIWVFEISQFLLVTISFVGLAYTLRAEGHVRVDAFTERLPERARYWLYIITSCLAIPYCGVLAWSAVRLAWRSFMRGEVTPDALAAPLWGPQLAIGIGAGLIMLQFLVTVSDYMKRPRAASPTATVEK